jgi:hypothetical protein
MEAPSLPNIEVLASICGSWCQNVCAISPPENVYSYLYSVSLRPTNEVGEDGWQFIIASSDVDVMKSEELLFETIASARMGG